ncbi:lactate 2-monooxygenase [Deinococcus reticulitermitis]|uniref:Lactate 2-monooxygenase n=1 Tax=Deinococcus reticulitermitis TaxID=856736 RepID=A0A1H6SID5_9DEIO|nr:alpha-hydroxy-acid oxidizing protein [Deinococcus reticulitermitis]SEI64627.1 lactate 2-monooxygenase [Deinococcus reticulitermitis]
MSKPTVGPGRARQTGIYVRGLGGEKPKVPVSPAALQRAAKAHLNAEAFAYVAGGAGAERTMRANLAAFEARRLVPRRLVGSSARDLSVQLFGHTYPAPVLLAPIGVLELAHPGADLAAGRAAASLGVPFVFSSQASVPMERVARAMGEAPRWFQLYWGTDDAVTRSFVQRAEAAGAQAIVLTLDTTLLGWRCRDLDLGHLPFLRGQGIAQYLSDPVFRSRLGTPLPAPGVSPPRSPALLALAAQLLAKGREYGLSVGELRAACARFVATYTNPDLSWDDLSRLREWTRLPILLKGVLHPDDAREAARRGVDSLIVSNHGGRQIDGEVAALDALPGVVAAAGDLPVLFDSGVRTGSDVAKALCLGARAVLLGRPYVYGLALAGEAGVREVTSNVIAEFDLTLGLLGARRTADLGPGFLASP